MSQEIVGLTANIYDFIVDSEAPLSARKSTFDAARERVSVAVDALAQRLADGRDRVTARARKGLDEALRTLREMRSELAERHPAPERLERLWKGLGTTYEGLRAHVRKLRLGRGAVVLAPVKPRNFTRNIFHVSMALIGALSYQFLLDRVGAIIVTGVLFSVFVSLEILRRRSEAWNRRFVDKMFKAIIRPGESHQIPASTWYIASLFLGCVIFPQAAIQVGVLVLGFGDPIAQIVGKRFGTVKLVGQKSVIGTIAFVVAALGVSFLFLSLTGHGSSPLARLGIAAVAAVAGAAAELFSGPLDDNFTIPLVAGGVAALLIPS